LDVESRPDADHRRHDERDERPANQQADEAGDEGDDRDHGHELTRSHGDVCDRQGSGQIGSLTVPLQGFFDGRNRPLAHVGHAAGLMDSQPGLGDPVPREQEQPNDEEAGENTPTTEP
jgi:hypothetical protein